MAILLLLSVWSWQPYILPYQWLWQSLLTLLLILLFRQQMTHYPAKSRAASLSEDGQWQWLDNQELYMVSGRSRFTPFLLWLHLKPVLASQQKSYWLWIAADSVSDTSYRRLSRLVYRLRS